MALIRFGGGVVDARGSVAGNTFTRSKAGAVLRCRRKPINPKSATQLRSRAYATQCTQAWSGTLTAAQRAAWDAYAVNTSWTNKLGESINIGGLAAFLRLNCLLLLAGEALRPAAPTAYGHAAAPIFVITAADEGVFVSLAEPSSGFAKAVDGTFLLLFQGDQQPAGRGAAPRGMQYLETIAGDSGTPETFPYEAGNKGAVANVDTMRANLFAVHIDANFRVSTRNGSFAIVA